MEIPHFNAHGLTQTGHLSISRYGYSFRALYVDFPSILTYSVGTANAGIKKVRHNGIRFLANYRGADAFKHGYTRAAGYTAAASAELGDGRIITVVFGGRSISTRNRQLAKLTDMGFKKLILLGQ